RPAAGIASFGSLISPDPGGPIILPSSLISAPALAQVPGINCAGPLAPAPDTALVLNPDSCSKSPAISGALTVEHVPPATWIGRTQSAGILSALSARS